MRVMMDSKNYLSKAKVEKNYGIITNGCKTEDITPEELAEKLTSGYAMRPAVLSNGYTKSEYWEAQSIFAVDIDNDNKDNDADFKYVTMEQVYNYYVGLGIKPIFIYKSYRYSEEMNMIRFRVVFCTNEEIRDREKRDKLQYTLMGLLLEIGNVDMSCTNAARLFLGTCHKDILYADYDSRINADEIINKYCKDEYINKINKKNASNKKTDAKRNKYAEDDLTCQNVELIRDRNVSELQEVLLIDENKDIEFVTDLKKAIDMAEYLGVKNPSSFHCIFHIDEKPSANIMVTKEKRIEMYKCFSSNCITGSEGMNIIALTQEIQMSTRYEAMSFLSEVYHITTTGLEDMKQNDVFLHNQLDFLLTNIEHYPDMYKFINKIDKDLKILEGLIKLIIDRNNEIQKTKAGKLVVRICLCEIIDYLKMNGYIENSDTNKMSRKIANFALLGLINKHSIDNLSDKTKEYYNNYDKHSGVIVKKEMLILSIPEYTDEDFNGIDEFCSLLCEMRYKPSFISERCIAALLRDEKALKEVYPDFNKNALEYDNKSKLLGKYFHILCKIEETIKDKGYMLNTDLSKYIKDKEYNCIISLLYENNISCVGINSEYKNKYPELKKVKSNKNYLLIKEE